MRSFASLHPQRLRELDISNVSVIDLARTVKAVRTRADTLRIALGRSRFRAKTRQNEPHLVRRAANALLAELGHSQTQNRPLYVGAIP
jgi:hypothetical protein